MQLMITEFMKNAVDKLRYQGAEEVEVEESQFSHFADKKSRQLSMVNTRLYLRKFC